MCLFCLAESLCFQQVDYALFELSLNENFTVFHGTSYTTFGFKQSSQFF